MDVALIPVWITAGISVATSVYAIVRNGTRQKEQDAVLKAELRKDLKVIKDQLDDPVNGLEAIKKATEDQKDHCLEVSTNISTRVTTAEKEIDRLRDKT